MAKTPSKATGKRAAESMVMVTVRLPASQVKLLKLVAAVDGEPLQNIVRDALADHLPRRVSGDKESRALLKGLLAGRGPKQSTKHTGD
jgi:hypothetical protein